MIILNIKYNSETNFLKRKKKRVIKILIIFSTYFDLSKPFRRISHGFNSHSSTIGISSLLFRIKKLY